MALVWEIELLAQNAEKFNYPTAPIVGNARMVTAIMKYIIRLEISSCEIFDGFRTFY